MSERRIEAADEFSAMNSSERFPTEDGVEEEPPRHFYSYVNLIRCGTHDPTTTHLSGLEQKTFLSLSHDASAAHLDLLFVPRVL